MHGIVNKQITRWHMHIAQSITHLKTFRIVLTVHINKTKLTKSYQNSRYDYSIYSIHCIGYYVYVLVNVILLRLKHNWEFYCSVMY